VAELVQNARNSNVSRFQQLVSDNVGTETGWQAIARMFRLTQSAVQMAGMGTAVARQIKEMTLNYFEDRFANWIVDQGGWVRCCLHYSSNTSLLECHGHNVSFRY